MEMMLCIPEESFASEIQEIELGVGAFEAYLKCRQLWKNYAR